jgi:hypothetical protein
LSRRLHVLKIFNELIKWGDIEAAHVVNCTDFIDDAAKEIGLRTGDGSLTRSGFLFDKSK